MTENRLPAPRYEEQQGRNEKLRTDKKNVPIVFYQRMDREESEVESKSAEQEAANQQGLVEPPTDMSVSDVIDGKKNHDE